MQELQTGQAKTFEGIPALTFIDKENYNPITRIFGYEQKPAENHTPENRSRQKSNRQNSLPSPAGLKDEQRNADDCWHAPCAMPAIRWLSVRTDGI